jgi:hypothetical protein
MTPNRASTLWRVAAAAVIFGFGTNADADEGTKRLCVAANERAQSLAEANMLSAALVDLGVCVAESCPAPVRNDCAQQRKRIERLMPTILFVVRGNDGAELRGAHVAIDGQRSMPLDGAAIRVDPGTHSFSFSADGHVSTSRTLLLRVGVKDRSEIVTLLPEGVSDAPREGPEPQRSPFGLSGPTQRTVAYALGGGAALSLIVATYLGLHAGSTYDDAIADNCPGGPAHCNQAGVDGVASAKGQAATSTGLFVVGAALLTGGIVLLATAPRDDAVRLHAAVDPTSASIRLGGSWQ